MFKIGEIVYHDTLHFKDGKKDNKKNRTCIVIYNNPNQKYVITIPITSTTESFNKNNKNYSFIPHVIYSERKLNFVKINNILKNSYDNTHTTSMIIDKETLVLILNKALKLKSNSKFRDLFIDIIENIKFEEKEQKRIKKLEKLNKRKQAKRNVNH